MKKFENDTVKSENDTVNDTVFYLIKQNNKITATEISERLMISLSTAKRKVKELKESGKVERIGSDKTGHWKNNLEMKSQKVTFRAYLPNRQGFRGK